MEGYRFRRHVEHVIIVAVANPRRKERAEDSLDDQDRRTRHQPDERAAGMQALGEREAANTPASSASRLRPLKPCMFRA